MNKDKFYIYIITIIIIVLQSLSLMKIYNLENQLQNVEMNMNNQMRNISSDINNISSNVDETLNKQASIIESFDYKIGKLDNSDLTVPINFTIIPKEVSKDTVVSIEIDDKFYNMDKNKNKYTATVSISIFYDNTPKVIIKENDVMKTEEIEVFANVSIKDQIIPELNANLVGDRTYGSDTYQRTGSLGIDNVSKASATEFTDVRLVVKVDDKLISDKTILPKDEGSKWRNFYYELDEEVRLTKGQTCTMTVIATDSLGLDHHILVDYWEAGSDGFMEDRWHNTQIIYSDDGKIIWKPDYLDMEY